MVASDGTVAFWAVVASQAVAASEAMEASGGRLYVEAVPRS